MQMADIRPQSRASRAARVSTSDADYAEDHDVASTEEGITIDEAFQSTVGEFGFGQQLFFVLTQLAHFPVACQSLVMVFTGLDPVDHRWFGCVPESPDAAACDAVLNSTSAPWTQFCALSADSHYWTRPSDSIISEWDLVCEGRWKQQAVNSGFFVGVFIGAGLFGTLSDRIGRKKGLYLASLLAGVSGVACGLSNSYWSYFAARLLTGIGVAGVGVPSYVLGCEYVGPSWRGFLGVAAQYFFPVGIMALTLFAYLLPAWRVLSIVTGLTALAFMAVLLVVPESPRWLLIAGRTSEASSVMQLIASWNGTRIPAAPFKDMTPPPRADNNSSSSGGASGLMDVLRHPVLRGRLIVQLVAWFSISCTYYGTSLMVADLPGSLYTNNLSMAAVEAFAYFLFSLVLDRLGRRWPIGGSYIVGGAFLALSSCLSNPTASIAFALLAKLLLAGSYAAVFIFAAELFPTIVRSASMGWMSQAARLGGFLSPFLVLLGHTMSFPLFGFLLLGAMNAAAGLLLLTQPETLGCVMPETMEDVSAARHRGSGTRSKAREARGSDGDRDEYDVVIESDEVRLIDGQNNS